VASAGTVTIDFAAETAKFTAELKKVQSSLKSLENGFGAMNDFVKKAGNAFAGIVSVGSIVSLARQAFEAADAIGDAAARAGVAVESLSRLAFAANQSDVEFSALTTGIRGLQRSMVEATAGTGNAADAFKRLGLNAAELRGLALEQQIGKIADSFKNVIDPAERTALAMQIFGKAGQDLVPLLAGGSAAIKELTEEADRLGVTLSTETAAGIAAADNAIKRLTASVNGFFASRIGDIALAIVGTDGLDQITKLQIQITRLREEKNRIELSGAPPGSGFAARLKEIGTELDVLQPKLDKLRAAQASQDAINAITQGADAAMRAAFAKADASFAKLQDKAASEAAARDQRNAELDQYLEFERRKRDIERQLDQERFAERQRQAQLLVDVDREALNQRVTAEFEAAQQSFRYQSDFAALLAQVRKNIGLQEITFEQIKSSTLVELATTAFTGLAGVSKKFAKIQQGIAAGEVIVATAKNIAKAFPNFPLMAKAAAIGAIQLAKIKAVSFDNPSASISVGAGGGGADTLNQADVGESVATGATQQPGTSIYISGFISRNTIDDLVGVLKDEFGRDVTIFGSNSRQAFDTSGAA